MSEQIAFNGFIPCARCRFGRDLGGNQCKCVNEERIKNNKQLLNPSYYTCGAARLKDAI